MTTTLEPHDAPAPETAVHGGAGHADGPASVLSTVSLAARNAWALSHFGDGVEPRTPLPSTVVRDSPHCTVRRYSAPGASGAPVLLVPPLAVSIDCYDLRPGQSIAAHFADTGRPVYVVDYGWMRYADRGMGFEDWFARIIPEAIEAVRRDTERGGPDAGAREGSGGTGGTGGTGVDLVAWSLGGTLSLLTAAAGPTLPIRSIAAMGTPIDYARNASIAPLRALGSLAPMPVVSAAVRATGGIPSPLVRLSYKSTALTRQLTRPWFIARNLADTRALAQMSAIDRFMTRMPGYPARFYTQMHAQLIMRNALATGTVRLGERNVELADIAVPVLSIAGGDDVLAPVASVEAAAGVLAGAPSVRVETVPGSHLGIVAGSRSAETTWPLIDRFHTSLG